MLFLFSFLFLFAITNAEQQKTNCQVSCSPSDTNMVCGFDLKDKVYRMYFNWCSLVTDADCNGVDVVVTPYRYCILANTVVNSRKMFEPEQSCPVFCPEMWKPVCAVSEMRAYRFRTFKNRCFLDMLNCRGQDDNEYKEVPLSFCPDHLMMNFFHTQSVGVNLAPVFEF